MTDPLATLPGTLDEVWRQLELGVADRTAPARHPVLATAGGEGAEARMVVLRAADRARGTLEIHTDVRSGKVAELRAEKRASLHVWIPDAGLQIRLRCHVQILAGGAAAPYWDAVPVSARALYGGDPAPGQNIDRPDDHAAGADPACFCVLRGRLVEIETLQIAEPQHRRAVFRAAAGWEGTWRAP